MPVGHASSLDRMAAQCASEMVHAWNALSGSTFGEPLKGHKSAMTSTAISTDGTRIICGTGDKCSDLKRRPAARLASLSKKMKPQSFL